MKKHFIALMAAAICLAAGCQRNLLDMDGGRIRFSASTEYDNGPVTKTVYSGQYESTTTLKERIDWVANDQIAISYKQVGENTYENAKYRIKNGTVSGSGSKSTAAIEPVGSELYWHEDHGTSPNSDHVFYAMYPANGFQGNTSASLVGNTVSGNIPATQVPTHVSGSLFRADMKYAYMVAYKRVTDQIPPSVMLPFRPAMTAFQFIINTDNNGAPVTVSKFEMEAAGNLTGDFSFAITGGDNDGAIWNPSGMNVTNGGNKITVNFPSPVTVNGTNQYLDLTLLALPVDISGVKITMTTSLGVKTLKLNDLSNNPVTFAACKKHIITNGTLPSGESWTYTVEDIDDIVVYGHTAVSSLPSASVKSYKTSNLGTVSPVAWTFQYATSASGPWYDTPAAAGISDRFSIAAATQVGGTTGESAVGSILRAHTASECRRTGAPFDTEDAAIAVLRNRTPLPTTTSQSSDGVYFDLSKHPIYGTIDGAEQAMETANCYVITAPGKYKFPTVYGNAIRNGSANQWAYAPQGMTAVNDINYYMRRFLRHDDQPIAGPWIFDDNLGAIYGSCDAVVVWQDVANASMQILLDSDISLSSDGKYIRFEIKEERIRPGNIVLALRNASGTILWSWHIWVTEKDLTPQTMMDKLSKTHSLLPYNLGWTDARLGYGEKWDDWNFYIKVKQSETGGTEKTFLVSQIGESVSVDSNVGSNTFYQWGRKDPMLPAKSSDDNKDYYSAQGYVVTESSGNGPRVVTKVTPAAPSGVIAGVGHAIKNPHEMYHNTNTQNYLAGSNPRIGNLWDANLISVKGGNNNAISINQRLPIKTVYDPSPRGFVVPYTFAFTQFSSKDWNFNGYGIIQGNRTSDGFYMESGAGRTLYFPFCGARGGDGVSPIYDVKVTAYYWTSGSLPFNDSDHVWKRAKYLFFIETNILAIHDQYKEGAYAVRPVIQVNFDDTNTGF